MSSSPRAPLKRGRSPSPDLKPTTPRPERKKPKLCTSIKPSARKQRLFQLLYRQKRSVAAPMNNASRKVVSHGNPPLTEGTNPVAVSGLSVTTGEDTFLQGASAVAVNVQGCPGLTVSADLNLPTLETDIPETTAIGDSSQLDTDHIPSRRFSVNFSTKSESPLSRLGFNSAGVPPSHDKLLITRARLKSKLRSQPWHPYAADEVKRKHRNGTKGAILQVLRKLIRSGEMKSAIQVDNLPSGQPTPGPSEEIKLTDPAMLLSQEVTGVLSLKPGHSSRPTINTDFSEFRLPSMSTDDNDTGSEPLESAIAPPPMQFQNSGETLRSPSFDLHIQHQHSGVSSSSTDGNFDRAVNTKSANSDADFLENHKAVVDHNLFHRQPDDTHMAPRYHDPKGSRSQNAGGVDNNLVFDSAATSTRSSQNASSNRLSIAHPDLVDMTSGEMFITTAIVPNETPGPHILPTEADMSASLLQLTGAILNAGTPGKSEVILTKVLLDNQNTDVIPIDNPPPDVVSNSVSNSNASSIPLSIAHPDQVDVTSGVLFVTTNTVPVDKTSVPPTEPDTSTSQLQLTAAVLDAAPPGQSAAVFNRNADVIIPSSCRASAFLSMVPASPADFSALAPTTNLSPLLAITSQVKPSKDLAMLEAQDSPIHPASVLLPEASNFVASSVAHNGSTSSISVVPFKHDDQLRGFHEMLEPQQMSVIQQNDISESQAVDESQIADIPQPAGPLQPSENHPTAMPRYPDVDAEMLSVNGDDFDGYAGDSDENQSAQILNSTTYHQLKTQPHDQCLNGTLAKIVEMLAKARSPSPRLPKSLKECGKPRQYDVSRENNQLKTCVREYTQHLLGQAPWDVPSEGELLAFENGRGAGPTLMTFHLDLVSRGLASKWNAQAAEVFTDAFLNEGELMRECSDRKAILSAFIIHLITLQKRYREPILLAKMTEAERNGQRDKQKQKVREQRKRGLFRRRINATKDYGADPLLKVLLTSFWPYCTPEVMSDDEMDSEWDGPADRVAHFIKKMNWRNPDVVDFFRVLDALYFSTRFQWNKWSPGRFPHTRAPSVRLTECDAVPGLPANFYRPQWLLQLSEIERRKLKIRPAINLDFSQEVLRIAARFLHIRHRKQLPLPRHHLALQAITRSTFPSGFPLENQLPDEEVLKTLTTQPDVPSTTDTSTAQRTGTTTPHNEPLPVSEGDATRRTVLSKSVEIPTPNILFNPISQQTPSYATTGGVTFTRLPTHDLSHPPAGPNNILVTPVGVGVVSLPGDYGRPIYLVNQPLDGQADFPTSYMVALGAVPSGSGSKPHGGVIPQSLNGTPGNWGTRNTGTSQKQIEPFTLGRHSRRFIKKSGKGKEKVS